MHVQPVYNIHVCVTGLRTENDNNMHAWQFHARLQTTCSVSVTINMKIEHNLITSTKTELIF